MSSNIEVFRAFAEGREASSKHVRCERVHPRFHVLYSYATPIAYRDDISAAFDERAYSPTTSKQRSQAMGACQRVGLPSSLMDHDAIRQTLGDLGADLTGAR